MKTDDFFYLGYVAKARGIKGEVSIYLDVDFPEAYTELESVFVELDKQPIPFFVEWIQIKDKNFASVKFEDVDTEEKAKRMVKAGVYLPIDQLPALSGNQFYYHEIPGFTVIDQNHGELGVVSRVLDYAANPLIEIKRDYKEILIPINGDVIREVNRKERRLVVETPEGLLGLYLEDHGDQDEDE